MVKSTRNTMLCVAVLPPALHLDRLFDAVLEIAIRTPGLVPSRLYWNAFSPTPIHVFVDEIEQAEAVVADTSEHTEEIWLATGCAVALGKPLCLISSAPEDANVPLGIQYLPHISYPIDAFPRDYIELQKKIYAQLSAIMPHANTAQPEFQRQESQPEASIPPTSVYSEDLASYEVMALTMLDLK